MSLFDDSDDSEAERKEKQRQNLETIQDPQKQRPHQIDLAGEDSDDDSGDLLSEEKELQRLRKSSIYQQYANKTLRNLEMQPGVADIADFSAKPADTEHDEAQQTQEQFEYPPSPTSSPATGTDQRPTAQNIQSQPQPPPPALLTRGSPKEKVRPARKGVDPKIIDDSSEDDSDSDSADEDERDDDEEGAPLGPMLPPPSEPAVALDDVPIQHEATLGTHHHSYVSCVTIEPSGNRMVTGCLDGTAKLWDFNSMDQGLRSFRTLTPLDESGLRVASFSPTGAHMLFAGGAPTAVVTDRDGAPLARTVRGDMYLVDAAQTKGHTAAVHAALWSAQDAETSATATLVTSGADATVRVWDAARTTRGTGGGGRGSSRIPAATQVSVFKLRTQRGGKAVGTAAGWVSAGRSLALACADGWLRVMDPRAPPARSAAGAPFAEAPVEPSGLACAPSGSAGAGALVAVRAGDSLHLLDARVLAAPVRSFGGLPNTVSETGVSFVGADGALLLTGTSASAHMRKRAGSNLNLNSNSHPDSHANANASPSGSLHLYSVKHMCHAWEGPAPPGSGSVISMLWHDRLNQIVYGTANGRVHILYHDTLSYRGVTQCLARLEGRRKYGVASVALGQVAPGSSVFVRRRGRSLSVRGGDAGDLDLGGHDAKRARRQIADALKPKPYEPATAAPAPAPASTPEKQQRATTMAKYLDAKGVSRAWSEDPREAILKYADVAKKNALFTKAYEKTQPKRLLAEKTAEQEEDESRQAIYDRDKLTKSKRSNLKR